MNRCLLIAGITLFGIAALPAWAQDSFGAQPGMGQPPYGMQPQMQQQMQMPQQQWGQPGMGGQMPNSPMPNGQMPDGQMLNSQMPGMGGMPGGQMPNGPMYGQMPNQMMPQQPMPGVPSAPGAGGGFQPPPNMGGGFGSPGQPMPGGPDRLDALMQMERQDYGVPPPQGLHDGAFHGPTPNTIPGGQVITTKGLLPLIQNQQMPKLVLDILGGPEHLPGAVPAAAASQPGNFQDQTQQGFGNYLNQATRGNKEMPLVFYCLNTQCWMSYNAAARAIALGYKNVLWYRGGIEAWKSAGLPVQPSNQQQRQ